MWKCPFCENQNYDNSKFCVCCGNKKPAENLKFGANDPAAAQSAPAYAAPQETPPQTKKKNTKRLTVLAVAAVAVIALFVLFVHSWKDATCTRAETCAFCGKTRGAALGHKWTAATCTEPETCLRCGETRGAALGHKWTAATCTEPETCTRCGATSGSAAGHSWAAATYDAPKTCLVCGMQEGKPLGYIGELYGAWSDVSLTLDNQTCYPFELSEPLKNCIRLKMDLMLSDVQGNPYGIWSLYARDMDGRWIKLDQFTVDENADGAYVTYEFVFRTPRSFTAIVPMVRKNSAYFHMSYYVDFYDAQVRE